MTDFCHLPMSSGTSAPCIVRLHFENRSVINHPPHAAVVPAAPLQCFRDNQAHRRHFIKAGIHRMKHSLGQILVIQPKPLTRADQGGKFEFDHAVASTRRY
jgi:hypothetical protein